MCFVRVLIFFLSYTNVLKIVTTDLINTYLFHGVMWSFMLEFKRFLMQCLFCDVSNMLWYLMCFNLIFLSIDCYQNYLFLLFLGCVSITVYILLVAKLCWVEKSMYHIIKNCTLVWLGIITTWLYVTLYICWLPIYQKSVVIISYLLEVQKRLATFSVFKVNLKEFCRILAE